VRSQTIDVRPLRSNDECYAAAAFQREIWGQDYIDIVPATLLHVVDYVGGLAAGAFDAQGTMLGFVFGVTGVRDGEIVHWSHMLGVRESARNLGLGRRLKEFQRDTLGALGVKRIFWTFDPLMAKNAYFNLNRLGAEVVEYVPDMYGTTTSPLHFGLATDRLVVSLATTPNDSVKPRLAPAGSSPVLTAFPRLSDLTLSVGDRSPDVALIEIPGDVMNVLARSPAAARTWRLAVRDHFLWALSHGYIVAGIHRDQASDRSFYLITRGMAATAALAAS
jgi:predicted GNAT superfamily acetyltransferase